MKAIKRIFIALICITIVLTQVSLVASARPLPEVNITLLPDDIRHTMQGWGVFTAFPSENMLARPAAARAIYQELGVTHFRIELSGYGGNPDGTLNYTVLGIFADSIQAAMDLGVTNYLVSIWSPPPHMKTNNDITGRNADGSIARLLVEYEQAFADWVVACFDYLTRVRGLPAPTAFAFMNEPENAMPYQSMVYDMEQYIRVSIVMRETLYAAGYGHIMLGGPSGGALYSNVTWLGEEFHVLAENEAFRASMDLIFTNGYTYPDYVDGTSLREFREAAANIPEMPVWQTEFSTTTFFDSPTSFSRAQAALTVMASHLNWVPIDVWFWWLGWTSDRSIDNPAQEPLLDGNGVYSVRRSMTFHAFARIFNYAPPGHSVINFEVDDPEIRVQETMQNDMMAFSDGNTDFIMLVNDSPREKSVNFHNMNGVSADIYYLIDNPSDTSLQRLARRNVVNRSITNVRIPANSIIFLNTYAEDIAAPLIEIYNITGGATIDDNGVHVVREPVVTLTARTDEAATVRIEGNSVTQNEDLTFSANIAVANAPRRVRVDATDMHGNMAYPLFFNIRHDPRFVNVELPFLDDSVNYDDYTITGRVNVPGNVFINGTSIEVGESGAFSKNVTLRQGNNYFRIHAVDTYGNSSAERVLTVFCDSIPPEITFVNTPTTVYHPEVIIRGVADKDLRTVYVNGQSTSIFDGREFVHKVLLREGLNTITIRAIDLMGNETTEQVSVTFIRTETTPRITDGITFSRRARNPISITGDLSGKGWILDNTVVRSLLGAPNNIFNFGTLWDERYLYVAFEVFDHTLLFDGDWPWYNDGVEVFVNGDGLRMGGAEFTATAWQFFITYTGRTLWDNGNGVRSAFHETYFGFTAEIAIPWSIMGVEPAEGVSIGFDVANNDKDEPGRRDSVLMWSGTGSNWHDTSNFGLLILTTSDDVEYVEKSIDDLLGAQDSDNPPSVVFVDDTTLDGNTPAPFLENGIPMIPLYAVASALGVPSIEYDNYTARILVHQQGYVVSAGSSVLNIGYREIELLAPAMMVDGVWFVSLDFFDHIPGVRTEFAARLHCTPKVRQKI